MALYRYQFPVGEGLYTDMNAIRRDEELDNLHSVYVDQWDWEKVIAPRGPERGLSEGHRARHRRAPWPTPRRPCDAVFPQLSVLPQIAPGCILRHHPGAGGPAGPSLTPKERENAWVKEHPTTFLMQIGGKLKLRQAPRRPRPRLRRLDPQRRHPLLGRGPGPGHSSSPPWASGWTPAALDRQLTVAGCDDRRQLPFHKMLLAGRAAPDHRRRHRPVPPVHAPAGQGPHRRGPGLHLGR